MRTIGGGPVVDGQYSLTFRIYADSKAKKAAWEETHLGINVTGGRFGVRLGSKNPLDHVAIAKMAAAELGIAINADPELSRQPLASVIYALHAGSAVTASKLDCSGCIGPGQIAGAAIKPSAISFTYAASQSKGGPADQALDLACTGCVSVKELAFDGDIDLKGHALTAGIVTAAKLTISGDAVVGGVLAAKQFIGDGSKLSGIQTPAGVCQNKGEVVRGINTNGSLICVKALDPDALPADSLDEISNGQLTTEFTDISAGKTNVPIKDNNPDGVTDVLDFPDVGTAKAITVKLSFTNSKPAGIRVLLFDPSVPKLPAKITDGGFDKKANFVLYDGGQSKGDVSLTLPDPDKPVSGDLGKWIGKNPKGKWHLVVIDMQYKDNKNDGAIKFWSIGIKTLSNKKVEAKGQLITSGGVDFASKKNTGFRFEIADKAPVKCDAAHIAYVYYNNKLGVLFLCDGIDFRPIAQVSPGTSKFSAAKSCKELLDKGVKKDGVYWLNPGSANPDNAFRTFCDQTQDGGGWTLVMRMKNDDGLIYNSGYWTNTSTFDQDSKKTLLPGLNHNAKFTAYMKVAASNIRGCKGAKSPCITVDMSGTKTAHKLFNEGYKSKGMSKSKLIGMFGNDPNQPHCNRSGLNGDIKYTGFRFGLAGNNENDCNSSDASWGWGVWGRSNKGYGCGCGLAGWSVAKMCFQGSLWVR